MIFGENFEESPIDKKWISVFSELEDIEGNKKEIKIELMSDGRPRAMAFFDIDGTLAHLNIIHSKAIAKLFPEEDRNELEETYFKGFQLGNSFREFDRMKGIYYDKKVEWKDPEYYFKNRFLPNQKEIDEPGYLAHNIAAAILKKYGELAAAAADELFQKNPEEFEKTNITPIFVLAEMYHKLGIPVVGFTANAKVFVAKLAKYLKLSDIFLDIATDETMVGGGKELAIHYLIDKLESKGIIVPKNKLIFVRDSFRGDIGTLLLAKEKNKDIHGQGILVLQNKEALIEIKKQISNDAQLKKISNLINIYGLVIKDVPLDEQGKPMLLSSLQDQFLEKI